MNKSFLRWRLSRRWGTLLLCIGLVQIGGCTPYSDGAADMKAHREMVAERTEGLRDYTARTKRGPDLAGQSLVDALSGRTLVYHYRSFPNGRRGNHVAYRYFQPDGRYVFVDNWLNPTGRAKESDSWKVTGPRLCLMHHAYATEPPCYRVARTDAGAIQFYTDDATKPYHGLLSHSTREIIQGPPPTVQSVYAEHYR